MPEVASSLVADQRRRGWRVGLAAPPELGLGEPVAAVGGHYVPWPAERGPGLSLAREAVRLRAIVGAMTPEIVHLHSSKAGLVGRSVIRGRLPTVFQPHAWSFEAVTGRARQLAVAWERFATRWADVVVCVSDDERDRAQQFGLEAHWRVVPNGIDLRRYRPCPGTARAEARRALALSDSPLAVVVGRLDVQKGQDTMLRVWPAIRERVPAAEIALVGDGPSRPSLETDRPPGVCFAGWAEDVRPWLAAADVVVLSSRWEAGLPLAAMEAMAMARSIVATEVAGTGVIREQGCGVVVPIDAIDRLVEALAERLANPDLADREGAAGRTVVERWFGLDAATERTAALYSEVLALRSDTRATETATSGPG